MLVDQGAEDDPRKVGQTDRCDVVDESTFPVDLEPVVKHHVPELDGPAPAGGSGQTEAKLVDRQPQILNFVVGETEATGEPRSCDPRQSQEFRERWY